MTGRFETVSLLTEPHTCSQPCSQGQGAYRQGVTQICEDCEAIFLKGQNKEIFIERGIFSSQGAVECLRGKEKDFTLTMLTNHKKGGAVYGNVAAKGR
ncbi:MAG TPA: hypothetical protein DCL35_06995 [Candidatus Omnitrophica bacterium]|nr:hypothetical protein [Candidatus Omnitrophota bacterium]